MTGTFAPRSSPRLALICVLHTWPAALLAGTHLVVGAAVSFNLAAESSVHTRLWLVLHGD